MAVLVEAEIMDIVLSMLLKTLFRMALTLMTYKIRIEIFLEQLQTVLHSLLPQLINRSMILPQP